MCYVGRYHSYEKFDYLYNCYIENTKVIYIYIYIYYLCIFYITIFVQRCAWHSEYMCYVGRYHSYEKFDYLYNCYIENTKVIYIYIYILPLYFLYNNYINNQISHNYDTGQRNTYIHYVKHTFAQKCLRYSITKVIIHAQLQFTHGFKGFSYIKQHNNISSSPSVLRDM